MGKVAKTKTITDAELLSALYETEKPSEAAERLGISTLELLRRAKHPRIQAQLRGINRAANEALAARLIQLSTDAIAVLHQLARDPTVYASVRMGAAAKLADLKDRYVEQDLVRKELEEVREELARIERERAAAETQAEEG